MQADTLSRLNTISETIPHDASDDIPVFLLDDTNLNLEFNRSLDEFDSNDV